MTSKRYKSLPQKNERLKQDTIENLLQVVKRNCTTRFDESIDVNFQFHVKQKKKVIEKVQEADINVMANYIFGLPGETKETMQKTFDLSLKLCTAGWNTYAAMALPGSQLYKTALDNKVKLPETYEGFSFHSFETFVSLQVARVEKKYTGGRSTKKRHQHFFLCRATEGFCIGFI